MQLLFRAEGRSLDCGDKKMKSITVLGILLAVLGIFALVYQGFSYTRQEKVFDVGPIHATRNDTERIPLPPIVGGLALLGGAALLVIGAKQKA
jgi:drug/metabolite transporter (DMT)-like permease